ncbi:threonine ammonia-lyase [Peptoniphilus sp. ING2-D1G]|nr:threonine ammonia-lyase [Peptoniphilus sp. ING2-D1G]
MDNKLTLDKVYSASFKLNPVVRRTDLIHARNLGENIYLKTENLQITGSFKIRGAYNKISQLSKDEKTKGVVATSAGNHAQGVALSCRELGVKCTIFMPENAPISKVEATKAFGAEVILKGNNYDDAYKASQEYNEKYNKTYIHAFNDIDVIAGQGTIGLEILNQLVDVDQVIVPIGGGGLISGIAFVIKTLKPDTKIIGVQAANAPSMKESIDSGEISELKMVNTFADGIAVKKPGDITYGIIKEYVDEIVTVTESEIASAILAILEKQKLICEGSGAVSFAATMHNKVDVENKKTVAILSGGNIDVNILSRIITKGLISTGRNTTLSIILTDKPGELAAVSKVISDEGANVIGVEYNTLERTNEIFSCVLNIKAETRNANHIQQIKNKLIEHGFTLYS